MLLEPETARSSITHKVHAVSRLSQRGWPQMNEFTITTDAPSKYTDAELDAMCLYSENLELKRQLQLLEEENLKLKNELLELSAQMEGMIYEN
jgi:hypothetical protein